MQFFPGQANDGLVLILGVGKCRRMLVQEGVTKEFLADYYHYSGFSTLEDWGVKIVHFIPNKWTLKYFI